MHKLTNSVFNTALKIHSEKQSDESVIEHCLVTNGSALEEKNADDSWNGTVLSTNSSLVDKSISVLDCMPDSGLSLQNESLKFSGQQLTSNFLSTFNSERNFSSANVVSGSFSKTEIQCKKDEANTSKHLSYDIFYKLQESDSYAVDKNSGYSQSATSASNNISQHYALNDCSPDEILCVSVEEKNVELNSHESQVEGVAFSAEAIAASDLVYEDKPVERSDYNESESFPNTKKIDLLSNTEIESEVNNVKYSENLCHPYQLKHLNDYEPEKLSTPPQKDFELQKNINDDERDGKANEDKDSFLPSEHGPFLCSKTVSLHSDDLAKSNSENKQQSTSSASSSSAELTAEGKDNLDEIDDLELHNIQKNDQVNQNASGENFEVHGIDDVYMNNLNIENAFTVQDDDSGVSSTEDISGNSPPEIANAESVDSIVREKCNHIDNFLNSEASSSKIPDDNVSEEFQAFENSVISTSEATDKDENQQERSCTDKNLCSVTDTDAKGVSNVFAGARPKLDNFNGNSLGSEFQAKSAKILDKEMNELDTSDAIEESVSPEKINLNKEIMNQDLENFNDSCISKHNVQFSAVKEMTHDNPISNFNEKTGDRNIEEITVEKQAMDGKIREYSEESSNSANNRDDCISPRLQRPTTLDLPSLLIASPETSDLSHSSCNDEVLVNVLPETATVEPNVSEFVPCVKQQPQIGIVKPYWIPDAEALNCMHCGVKFTVIKRRHHCRGCGKVLCSRCCNQKAYLSYLNKEDRICQPCSDVLSSTLHKDQMPVPFDSQSSSSCGSSPNFSPSPQAPASNFADKAIWRPHPNNPDDYCSTIPPLQQIQSSEPRPPPTVMVPIGVLKRGNKPRREPKQVIFSDGIRPGGDLTDLTEPVETVPVCRRIGDSKHGSYSIHQKNRQKKVLVSDGEGPLPPIVLQTVFENDEKIDWNQILEKIQDSDNEMNDVAPVSMSSEMKNIMKMDCCFGNECWCFTSHGLCTVGQDEIMVVLQRLPGERNIPRDIFKLFTQIHDNASKGVTFDDLGHIIFPEQILGSSDHRGFLFVRPTFQCLSKLTVPNTPYLVAILIHKWEVPWAKVFPLRLMLRMGAECRYYPCALVSVRHRKPVYFEIGQTIMSVLADLRNFQFTIPVIPGLVVHMEEKKTCVNIPRNRYDKVMKVLNSNNVEHVLALGSNFSTEADSHLVCMQKEEGDYQTQAINIENTTRRGDYVYFVLYVMKYCACIV
ncbi:zinc finger FYVE domain-containing protein 9 [Trichonephila clavipes]|nr:zinc finger FYVE domain-containing protein 9 [Trichonephila clavipes]